MEESLPRENHSVVRKMFGRLDDEEEMSKKTKNEEKLKEVRDNSFLFNGLLKPGSFNIKVSGRTSDEEYKMTSSPRGFFVIINMLSFDAKTNGLVERKGSEKDVEKLLHLCKNFGFKNKPLLDKKKDELLNKLKKIKKEPGLESHDCFALYIMSHGAEDYFFASDGEKIAVEEIIDMFKNSACSSLKGKPKLFFIQACRNNSVSHKVESDSSQRKDEYTKPASSNNSDDADILTLYSCCDGEVSYRYEEQGSVFIKSLVEVFSKYARNEDVLSMATRVIKKVREESVEKQTPNLISSLTKKVFFKF